MKPQAVIASRNLKARNLAPEQAGLDVRFVPDFELVYDEYHIAKHHGKPIVACVIDCDLPPKRVSAIGAARYLKRQDKTLIVIFVGLSLTLDQRLELAPLADAVFEGEQWPVHLFKSLEALVAGKREIDQIRQGESLCC